MSRLLACLTLAVLPWAASAAGDDAFYQIRIGDLKLTEGSLPDRGDPPDWRRGQSVTAMAPYAVLDGHGEAYLQMAQFPGQPGFVTAGPAPGTVFVRIPKTDQVIAGRLFVPNRDWSGMVSVRFKIPAATAESNQNRELLEPPQPPHKVPGSKPESVVGMAFYRSAFYQAKETHYQALLARDIPGGAWFRHQVKEAKLALGQKTDAGQPMARVPSVQFQQPDDLGRTYDLFSGGRAMSENLQLDRQLPPGRAQEGNVKIDSLKGITIREIDWKERIKDLKPELDPLAAAIPADQHVVFFPSFQAAVRVADEAARQGVPVLRMADPRAEDAQTEQRYQRQLGLSMTEVSRLLGPRLVRSVALTGSDPYFPTGTDVAVLFESPRPAVLENLILTQVGMAADTDKEVQPVKGEAGGVSYRGFLSPDRRISSYVARLNSVVVVTNSPYQLQRLAEVQSGKSSSIASLPEYVFFRSRYQRRHADETGLVFLSDATIRRWCGPKWRTASSRRTRDAAVLAELQASQSDTLVRKGLKPGPIYTDLATASAGELTLTGQGVASSTLGTLAFLTPIAEMPLDEVTPAEAEAYNRWREGYERNWNWAFDPIALRLTLRDEKLAADLSVMPLILGSEYRELAAISQGGKFTPDAGDPHGARLHFILALDPKSPIFQTYGNLLTSMVHGASLGWIGSSLAIYADADPFWQELAKQKDQERVQFLERNVGRLPLAVQIEVSNGLKLAAFLAGVRTWIEQSSPGMVHYDTLSYHDQPYVKVSPTDRARTSGVPPGELALYYSASGDALILTLREDLLHRALDRQIARAKAKDQANPPAEAAKPRPWLGSNVGLQVDSRAIEYLMNLSAREIQNGMRLRAWGNLPILNEWKRCYPKEDPVKIHRRLWHTELVCPGGGRYEWNEQFQTMESTVYGHPGQPKDGPAVPPLLAGFRFADFGLTFEDQGLRAAVSLERCPEKKAEQQQAK
jgi:hypothetical protein